MPIPLGILAAAGVSPAAGGSYELIETITVGSGGAASVTFSNLNTYSSTYQHFQIRAIARMASGGALWQTMTFNGVGGTSYASHGLVGNGSNVTSQNQTSADSMRIGFGDSDQFVASVIDILDPYETNKNKTVRSLVGGHGFVDEIHLRSGLFMSTNAISSITLTTGVNYVQGSRFSIYGLKAS